MFDEDVQGTKPCPLFLIVSSLQDHPKDVEFLNYFWTDVVVLIWPMNMHWCFLLAEVYSFLLSLLYIWLELMLVGVGPGLNQTQSHGGSWWQLGVGPGYWLEVKHDSQANVSQLNQTTNLCHTCAIPARPWLASWSQEIKHACLHMTPVMFSFKNTL
jgi:hypothetical protein